VIFGHDAKDIIFAGLLCGSYHGAIPLAKIDAFFARLWRLLLPQF